ncbi:MAG: N-acetylmuramoyl-L-alanine amidase family protein [Myxococcales bacterium]|jgi:MYXO-CTERM domain-containing protein
MNARILIAALVALLPASAGASKVFLCPTTQSTAVGSGTRAGYALDVANKASTRLQGASLQTQVQAGPIGTSSSAAVDAANTWNADAFVSVASNAGGGHGPETYCWKNPNTGNISASGQALAGDIQDGLLGSYTLPDRGVKTNSTWDVLKRTTMPAAVTYVVFDDCTTSHSSLPSSASERAFLESTSGRQTIGTGLANGVCAWLGVSCDAPVCTPTTEICDGRDNDCDGQIDENNPGGGASCSTGQPGVCSAGTTRCSNGRLECTPNVTPSAETCNGKDDDCDGQVDENNPGGGASCNTGQPGACAQGVKTCRNGQLECVATPATETCNGKDDDCDGQVDEGNPGGGASCSTGQQGICAVGVQTCLSGQLTCVATSPTAETCNGKDDDCDGEVDEGNPGGGGSCNTGNPGVCNEGEKRCLGGNLVCMEVNQATPEVCDGKDNDCDGTVDEDVQSGGDCTTGLPGVCAAGEAHCEGGTFACVQKVQPSAEICDGKDNDCNGQVDDSPSCQPPDAGQPGADAGLPIVDKDAGVEEDAGKPRGKVPEVPNAGCGCTAGLDGSALLGLFALAGLIRRRRG